ncbi:MAG TPA: hypothetical protein VHT97_11035 [Acidimicrobiales bacterium]|jgi:hypothetical protein|nr:hypothetical protein [Acidimicrobiales bacterium]
MIRTRRRFALGVLAAAAIVVPAGLAWACVAPVSLTVNNPTVQPGGTVTVLFREFAQGAPIEVHLDSPTGPLLGTAAAPTTTMTSSSTLDVTIPSNTTFGTHVLVSVQNYHNMNSGNIARATIYVGTLPPPTVAPAARLTHAEVSSGPSGASLALIGLGVGAGLLLLAAVWSLAAGGGRSETGAPAATK